MPTVVRDALAPNLLAGATLNAAGTTTGTVVEVAWPGTVQVSLETATVTGTTPTLDIVIEGSNVANFATFKSYGRLASVAANSNTTRKFVVDLQSRYVRARVIVGGTSPVYTGTTAFLRLPQDRLIPDVSTA